MADPSDLDLVATVRDQVEAAPANWIEGMIIDLAARDDGNELVEQADQRAHDPALRLSPLPEQDDVVAGDDRVGQLRQHGVVVTHDAGEQLLARPQSGEEVAAHLLFDRLAPVSRGPKLGDGVGSGRGHPCTIEKQSAASANVRMGFLSQPG